MVPAAVADAYRQAAGTPSDINEHLPRFVEIVREIGARTVIELGTRTGVSTVAWLYALEETDGRLWSVDLDARPALPFRSDRWTFIQGDDLDPDVLGQLPDQADIVFVDTSHAYSQTLAELNVYRWRVRPGGKIVLHDTELARPLDAGVGPRFPVKTAVEEFCAEEFCTVRYYPNCFGLAVVDV